MDNDDDLMMIDFKCVDSGLSTTNKRLLILLFFLILLLKPASVKDSKAAWILPASWPLLQLQRVDLFQRMWRT